MKMGVENGDGEGLGQGNVGILDQKEINLVSSNFYDKMSLFNFLRFFYFVGLKSQDLGSILPTSRLN